MASEQGPLLLHFFFSFITLFSLSLHPFPSFYLLYTTAGSGTSLHRLVIQFSSRHNRFFFRIFFFFFCYLDGLTHLSLLFHFFVWTPFRIQVLKGVRDRVTRKWTWDLKARTRASFYSTGIRDQS
ncbi:hypothetical protein BJ508DRAFT_86927 [Ascobolus immersus RN42]|uniref:Uncharacterized protein n=1 Tax=Ascobolus immersus RN42 TaxID=1160509 RepID=A0A3N4IAZ8_ASCIM|nr:hypothetical protein BJ508DRAFT_86927 [Ascobolus immersus RN42]